MILALLLTLCIINIADIGTPAKADIDESRDNGSGTGQSGSRLPFSTYFGGDRDDNLVAIHHTPNGETVVCGYTESNDIHITTGALFPQRAGSRDVFVSKFDKGDELVFSTFIGGGGADIPKDIIVDEEGDIHITGTTSSEDWPITEDAYQATYKGSVDIFVCELSSDGSEILYSTYLGGSNSDHP
jgi:hypothetical protein